MKHSSWLLTGVLLLATPGCIFVRVTGDLDEEFWGDGDEDDDVVGCRELEAALDGCLADPKYELHLGVTPWRTEAEWTVHFASNGSDGHAAYHKVREAVLGRIAREGGVVTEQEEAGPSDWSCRFRLDGEPGEASVRLVESTGGDEERPHRLEVVWEETD